MRRVLAAAALIAAGLMLTGCATSRATTQVRKVDLGDGTFVLCVLAATTGEPVAIDCIESTRNPEDSAVAP